MYNKVILVGNLTRDIELRYSQGGMAIANAGLATSRKFTLNGEKKRKYVLLISLSLQEVQRLPTSTLERGVKSSLKADLTLING